MTTSSHTPSPTREAEATPSSFAAVVSSAFVSNPRRSRGLDAEMLVLPARPSGAVGTPGRTRSVDTELVAG